MRLYRPVRARCLACLSAAARIDGIASPGTGTSRPTSVMHVTVATAQRLHIDRTATGSRGGRADYRVRAADLRLCGGAGDGNRTRTISLEGALTPAKSEPLPVARPA